MSDQNQFLLYTAPDRAVKVDVYYKDETVWLTQKALEELFQRDKSGIFRHIRNVFAQQELARNRVVANFATTAADGMTYQVEFFNLSALNTECLPNEQIYRRTDSRSCPCGH